MTAALGLLLGCQQGAHPCIFDGTSIGITAIPMVALHPDGTLDQESRYSWQDFPWPTDPQLVTVEHVSSAWTFRGTTGGQPWAFKGSFSEAGGAFVRLSEEGAPPVMEIVAREAQPMLLRYRVKPCRAFQGSKTGDRSCTSWGHELNARTTLHCE